jgi:hypothetical protein
VAPPIEPRPFSTLQRSQKTRSVLGLKAVEGRLAEARLRADSNPPLPPVDQDDSEDGPGLSRTQSLRDLTSRFERLQTGGNVAPTSVSPSMPPRKSIGRGGDKRLSLMERDDGMQVGIYFPTRALRVNVLKLWGRMLLLIIL